jgi:SAM-dependent methyltransferase
MSREKQIRDQYEAADHADNYTDQRWTQTRHARKTNQWERNAVQSLVDQATEWNGGGLNRILDMPCGFGRFQELLGAASQSLIQADLAMSMLQRRESGTKTSGSQSVAETSAMQASLLQIPLKDGCIDLNLCMRVLHHFPDTASRVQILCELARVSRFAIVSYYDAAAFPHWRDRIRRRKRTLYPIRNSQFDAEANLAGFKVLQKRFRRRWWSLQTLALLESENFRQS